MELIENIIKIIDKMKDKVLANVHNYQTDAMIDIVSILEKFQNKELPHRAFWVTRETGTSMFFAKTNKEKMRLQYFIEHDYFEDKKYYLIKFDTADLIELTKEEFISKAKNI